MWRQGLGEDAAATMHRNPNKMMLKKGSHHKKSCGRQHQGLINLVIQ